MQYCVSLKLGHGRNSEDSGSRPQRRLTGSRNYIEKGAVPPATANLLTHTHLNALLFTRPCRTSCRRVVQKYISSISIQPAVEPQPSQEATNTRIAFFGEQTASHTVGVFGGHFCIFICTTKRRHSHTHTFIVARILICTSISPEWPLRIN